MAKSIGVACNDLVGEEIKERGGHFFHNGCHLEVSVRINFDHRGKGFFCFFCLFSFSFFLNLNLF